MQEDIGIILRSQQFKERDRLVTILSENNGKISGIAKGAIHSKRFGGSLDLFTCSQFCFKESQSSDLVRIDEANIRRDFLKLRETLENITVAGYFTDLCLRLTEERQPAREIFLLLAHYFYLLEEKVATFEIVRSFEIKLLDRLGYAPNLENCTACENELSSIASINIDRGGFLCANCAPVTSRKTQPNTIPFLRVARDTLIQNTHLLQTDIAAIQECSSITQTFLRYHSPGLANHNFQNHEMMEALLNENRNT